MGHLERYAELAVVVGTGLRPGQRLVICAEPEHAPLVRAVAESGWRAGAGDVDCYYVDDHLRRLHAFHAADDLLDRTPDWLVQAARSSEDAAFVHIVGDADPNLFHDVDPARAARADPLALRQVAPGPDAPPRLCLDGGRMPDRGLDRRGARNPGRRPHVGGDRGGHASRRRRSRDRVAEAHRRPSRRVRPHWSPRASTSFASAALARSPRSACSEPRAGRPRGPQPPGGRGT